MDNKVKLSKENETKPPISSGNIEGFQGNGSFYGEVPAEKQKNDLRINAAIKPKTFNALVIGFVALSVIGLAAVIIVTLIKIGLLTWTFFSI